MNPNSSIPDDELEDKRLTLVEHLDELRSRIIRVLAAVTIGMVAAFVFSGPILDWLIAPCLPVIKNTYYTSILQPFNIRLKAAFFGGLILVSPYIFFQIWQFVKPALTLREKKIIRGLFGFALLLFLSGVALGYYLIVPQGTRILISYATPTMKPLIGIEEVVNFVIFFLLGLGIIFEIPILLMGLAKIGLIDNKLLSKNRRYAIFGSVFVAVCVTPGSEVVTSIILSLPLYLLYEVSILLIKFVKPWNRD